MDAIFEATRTLGMPVVVATVLIWHFLRSNRALAEHNRQLLTELGQLREMTNKTIQALQNNEKLVEQNERLVTAIKASEKESLALVRYLVEIKISANNSGEHDERK